MAENKISVELVAIEAYHRLLNSGVDARTLEYLKRVTSTSQVPMNIARISQLRDYPTPMPPGWNSDFQYTPAYATHSPSEIVDTLLDSFCHNPNCMTSYCTVHRELVHSSLPRRIPSVVSSNYLSHSGKDSQTNRSNAENINPTSLALQDGAL